MPNADWPPLPLAEWKPTYDTLHMWTQVVGKVCLALSPMSNHYWNIAFHFVPVGLSTALLTQHGRSFSMTFDFVNHRLEFQGSDGTRETIPLIPRTVADFYSEVMARLDRMG